MNGERRRQRSIITRAGGVLKFPLLEFTSPEIPAIAEGLSEAMSRYRYTCHACAIMSDHVHLLIRKHRDKAEEMIENVQEVVRLRLGGSPGAASCFAKASQDRRESCV